MDIFFVVEMVFHTILKDLTLEMIKNYFFWWQAACNKLLKDAILDCFTGNLPVVCRHHSGSSLNLGDFFMLKWL